MTTNLAGFVDTNANYCGQVYALYCISLLSNSVILAVVSKSKKRFVDCVNNQNRLGVTGVDYK